MRLSWFRRSPTGPPPTEVEPGIVATVEPVAERVAEAPAAPAQQDHGWFTKEQVLEYESTPDEDELVRRIAQRVPGASREEALFRYELSRSVGLQDLELPLLPATATQVLRLARDANASVRDYVGVVQSDPSLV